MSSYSDFNQSWYKDVAPIMILTQLINVFSPQVDYLVYGMTKMFARHIDRGLCSCFYRSVVRTKSATIHEYVDLHAGPDYFIFFKYAFILKMILFSALYGSTIPIVFPINFLAFLNMYFTERYLLAKFYRKPPVIDKRVSTQVIKELTPAVLLGFMFAFWMLGEPCSLLGEVKWMNNLRQNMQTTHTLTNLTYPSLFLLIVVFILHIGINYFGCFKNMKRKQK